MLIINRSLSRVVVWKIAKIDFVKWNCVGICSNYIYNSISKNVNFSDISLGIMCKCFIELLDENCYCYTIEFALQYILYSIGIGKYSNNIHPVVTVIARSHSDNSYAYVNSDYFHNPKILFFFIFIIFWIFFKESNIFVNASFKFVGLELNSWRMMTWGKHFHFLHCVYVNYQSRWGQDLLGRCASICDKIRGCRLVIKSL